MSKHFSTEKIERNSFTLSLVLLLLSLFCLFIVQPQSASWYVLILVISLNAALLFIILYRIFKRKRENK